MTDSGRLWCMGMCYRIAPALSTSIMLNILCSVWLLICLLKNRAASTVPSAYICLPHTLCWNWKETESSGDVSVYVWKACPSKAFSGTCISSSWAPFSRIFFIWDCNKQHVALHGMIDYTSYVTRKLNDSVTANLLHAFISYITRYLWEVKSQFLQWSHDSFCSARGISFGPLMRFSDC